MKNVAVIIYAYNQESTIGDIVKSFIDEDIATVVITDYSTDLTSLYARMQGAWVVNSGKKLGVAKGFCKAFRLLQEYDEFDYIATLDSQDVCNPQTLYAMLELMPNNDLVIGSRFLPTSVYVSSSFFKGFLHRFFAYLFYITLRTNYTDWSSSLRVYRSNLIQELLKSTEDYTEAFHIEMLAKAHSLGATISEYPLMNVDHETNSYSNPLKTWLKLLKSPKRPIYNTSEDIW